MTEDISKTPARIASMFDAIAERYDLLNHLLSAGIDRRWRRRAIRALSLTGCETVLDLCTGTADLALAARAAVPGAARVVGIDFAGAMLRLGQAKLRVQRAAERVALIAADATQIPLRDRSVDAVTIAFGIRNVDRPQAACAEMRRVLRAGGRLAILEFAIPTTPVIRSAYLAYFKHVLPRVGALISGHQIAYSYLPASVGAFATPEEVMTILRQHGFVDVHADPLTFGTVYLYTGRKPRADS